MVTSKKTLGRNKVAKEKKQKKAVMRIISNFVDFDELKNNPDNRCSVYTESIDGERNKRDYEIINKKQYSADEVATSNYIVNKCLRSIERNGLRAIATPKVFVTKKGDMVLLDNHHLVRAIIEYNLRHNANLSVNLVAIDETPDYKLKDATLDMCITNTHGSTPWRFIDSVRRMKSTIAQNFIPFYRKYRASVPSVAVLADAYLNIPTSTKRKDFEDTWGENTTKKEWGYANEYLDFAIKVMDKVGMKLSQPASDALRELFNIAIAQDYLSAFKYVLLNRDINVQFRGCRPSTKDWKRAFKDALSFGKERGINAKVVGCSAKQYATFKTAYPKVA